MNKTKFKLIALLGLIIILLCCLLFKTEIIEEDLYTRTNNALIVASLNDINVSLDGRDVYLNGTVINQQIKEQAEIIAADIWGVRTVFNDINIEEVKEKPTEKEVIKKVLKDLSVANVEFELEKAIIKPESYHILNDLVDILTQYPDANISINGHADATGNADFNKYLSKKRAESVKAYLIKKGIKESRLIANGFGSAMPIATNSTPEGRKKNRRVEFKLREEK